MLKNQTPVWVDTRKNGEIPAVVVAFVPAGQRLPDGYDVTGGSRAARDRYVVRCIRTGEYKSALATCVYIRTERVAAIAAGSLLRGHERVAHAGGMTL